MVGSADRYIQRRRVHRRHHNSFHHRVSLQGELRSHTCPNRLPWSSHSPSNLADEIYLQSNNHAMMGSTEDPKDGGAVAAAVFGAVAIYGAFLIFCGIQALLHMRESRRGAISLS